MIISLMGTTTRGILGGYHYSQVNSICSCSEKIGETGLHLFSTNSIAHIDNRAPQMYWVLDLLISLIARYC